MKGKFPVLIRILMILLSSCKEKCEQHMVADLRFTESDLKMNPYTGKETLTFRSQDGFVVSFPPGERIKQSSKRYERDSETARIDFDGCQGDYLYTETDHMYRSSLDGDFYFSIILNFNYSFGNPTNDKNIDFYIKIKDSVDHYVFNGNFIFRNDSILNEYFVTYYPLKASIKNFYPQITFQEKLFHNTYEFDCISVDNLIQNWISKVYYSTSEGLIAFETNHGKQWIVQ